MNVRPCTSLLLQLTLVTFFFKKKTSRHSFLQTSARTIPAHTTVATLGEATTTPAGAHRGTKMTTVGTTIVVATDGIMIVVAMAVGATTKGEVDTKTDGTKILLSWDNLVIPSILLKRYR